MRGYVYMLEAVFAGIILVGFMLYLAHGYNQSHSATEHDFGDALHELSHKGLLMGYAFSGDIQGIEDGISLPGFGHSVQICTAGGCTGEGGLGSTRLRPCAERFGSDVDV